MNIILIIFQDPKSLPESWKNFFEGLNEDEKTVSKDLKGPTWSPEKKLTNLKEAINNKNGLIKKIQLKLILQLSI